MARVKLDRIGYTQTVPVQSGDWMVSDIVFNRHLDELPMLPPPSVVFDLDMDHPFEIGQWMIVKYLKYGCKVAYKWDTVVGDTRSLELRFEASGEKVRLVGMQLTPNPSTLPVWVASEDLTGLWTDKRAGGIYRVLGVSNNASVLNKEPLVIYEGVTTGVVFHRPVSIFRVTMESALKAG